MKDGGTWTRPYLAVRDQRLLWGLVAAFWAVAFVLGASIVINGIGPPLAKVGVILALLLFVAPLAQLPRVGVYVSARGLKVVVYRSQVIAWDEVEMITTEEAWIRNGNYEVLTVKLRGGKSVHLRSMNKRSLILSNNPLRLSEIAASLEAARPRH